MTEQNSFDEFFKKRLDDHESSVPEDLFERMMREKEARSFEENPDTEMANRLNDYASNVPNDMFERIMQGREVGSENVNTGVANRLNDYVSNVPNDMFERIMSERERRKVGTIWWKTPSFRWTVAASIVLLMLILVGKSCRNKTAAQLNTAMSSENKVNNNPNMNNTLQNTEGGVSQNTGTTISENINTNNDKNIGIITNKATQSKKTESIPSTKLTTNRFPNSPIKAVPNSTTITSNFEHPSLITNHPTQNTQRNPSQQEGNPMTFSPEYQRVVMAIVQPLAVLNTEGVSSAPLSYEKLVKDIPCLTPGTTDCPTFTIRKSKGLKWYVDAYGAPEYAFRALTTLTDEFTSYRNARDTAERYVFAFSAGTRASVVMKNGLALRGGIVYARNNEMLRKDSSTLEVFVTTSQSTGDTVAWIYERKIFRQTRGNYIQTLDFTLQAGYELPIADRLKIGLNAGVNINAMTQIKATILDKDRQLLATTANNTIYNKSVGTSLVGSIGAYYHLTDRLELMVEPQFRYYLKPITKNPDYPLKQAYSNAGLIVGARFRIR